MHHNARRLPAKEDAGNVIYSLFYCFEVNFRMAWAPPQPPSEQLKDIRGRLGITTREVSDFSQKIADAEGNPEFHISNAWLTQVENSDSVPSIFKLYSLSSIYHIQFTDLLRLSGVALQHLSRNQLAAPRLPPTCPISKCMTNSTLSPSPFASIAPSMSITPISSPASSKYGAKCPSH